MFCMGMWTTAPKEETNSKQAVIAEDEAGEELNFDNSKHALLWATYRWWRSLNGQKYIWMAKQKGEKRSYATSIHPLNVLISHIPYLLTRSKIAGLAAPEHHPLPERTNVNDQQTERQSNTSNQKQRTWSRARPLPIHKRALQPHHFISNKFELLGNCPPRVIGKRNIRWRNGWCSSVGNIVIDLF